MKKKMAGRGCEITVNDIQYYSTEMWDDFCNQLGDKMKEKELNIVSTPWAEDSPFSKDNTIEVCHGKVCHATKRHAMFATKGSRKPYKCSVCNCWHTGRSKGSSNQQQKKFKNYKKKR